MNKSILLVVEALKEIKKLSGVGGVFIHINDIAKEAIKKWEDSSGKETGMSVYVPIEIKEGCELPQTPGWYFCYDTNYSTPFHVSYRFDNYNKTWFTDEGDGRHPQFWLKPVKLSELQSVPPYKEEVDKERLIALLKDLVQERAYVSNKMWEGNTAEEIHENIDEAWYEYKKANNILESKEEAGDDHEK